MYISLAARHRRSTRHVSARPVTRTSAHEWHTGDEDLDLQLIIEPNKDVVETIGVEPVNGRVELLRAPSCGLHDALVGQDLGKFVLQSQVGFRLDDCKKYLEASYCSPIVLYPTAMSQRTVTIRGTPVGPVTQQERGILQKPWSVAGVSDRIRSSAWPAARILLIKIRRVASALVFQAIPVVSSDSSGGVMWGVSKPIIGER